MKDDYLVVVYSDLGPQLELMTKEATFANQHHFRNHYELPDLSRAGERVLKRLLSTLAGREVAAELAKSGFMIGSSVANP